MNSSDPIGGYFELELEDKEFLHDDSILLNTGRNCFEYILRANRPSHIHLPRYICDVMLEPLKKLNIPHTFYSIDENLEIAGDVELNDSELLLYVNYFGLKDNYCRLLVEKYKDQLIIDSSQAYYFQPIDNGHTIYSPRKFFGVPDGGCLYTKSLLDNAFPEDTSYERMTHLLKRIDLGAEEAYADFRKNDDSLKSQPIKQMSKLTKKLLGNTDFEAVKQKRIQNFDYLQKNLKDENQTNLAGETFSCALVYPFISKDPTLRQKLIDQKIFVATYWPNIMEWCGEGETEYNLAKNLLPLPIDQRYGIDEMKKILEIINGS